MSYGTVQAEKMTTESGYSLGAGNASSFKNRIINGNMVIDQRATAITLNTAGTFMTDRWCQNNGGSAVMTGARSTNGPTGLTQSSLLITTTTGSAPSAGNLVDIFQPIEGYNIADLAYGTASAQTTTVSFWVKSSLTGTFCVAYGNASGNRSYVTTYTINSANTWEYKTVTITGDTTGTWGTTNGVGLSLFFDMGSGSNYNTTANAWASGFYTRVSGATSLSATTGATWQVTGVQLEVGTVATSFDTRSYGTELALCQRYFYQWSAANSASAIVGSGQAFNATQAYILLKTAMTMRVPPTTFSSAGSFGSNTASGGGLAVTAISLVSSWTNENMITLEVTVGSGWVAGNAALMNAGASTACRLNFSAEF
jgi:hypothetical protein